MRLVDLINKFNNPSFEFQFLLVRLVESIVAVVAGAMFISIPFGAISSPSACFFTPPLNFISIPFGAISSRCFWQKIKLIVSCLKL